MIKVISFVATVPKTKPGKPVMIEYPELAAMLSDGWEIIDTLPTWGSGDAYVQTFTLAKEEKDQRRKR